MEKTFVTRGTLNKVCFYLIVRGKEFTHTPGVGVTFKATDEFVKEMQYKLVTCYGCSLKPIINEVK